MTSAVMTSEKDWTYTQWQRQLETFGPNDAAVTAHGPQGETDNVCNLGELTDKGRQTTLALGQRLRRLYVQQLGFLPAIAKADELYVRASPMPRALESVQQTLQGLYPAGLRRAIIKTRTFQQETLFPNEANCARFSQLTHAFAERTALRWNDSPEMAFLNAKLRKYMPQQSAVAVDSHPRLSGILDTINSTLAHGPKTRLSQDFYDDKVRQTVEKIETEEWFDGYKESREYRMLGIGSLAGDLVARMVSRAGNVSPLKFGLSGCHDTTLAALMSSFGCFEHGKWPPYSSHIALELFSRDAAQGIIDPGATRKPLTSMSTGEKMALEDYFVRIRYNDEPVVVPGCRVPGKHLADNPSFCTLVS